MKLEISKKWPSKKQWLQFFKVLSKKEKIAFFIFLSLFWSSAISLATIIYFENTEIRPAVGGRYIEGMVGSPRFINPIYANSDVDRALVEIIFSGLFKYDGQGQIVPDLAKEMPKISEDGQIYEVSLRENLFWHDGQPLTADDVIFTIQTIQNPDFKSPLRGKYLGIEVEKIDDLTVQFKLRKPYSGFLERLTFKIIPKHIWQDLSPQNFVLSKYNLRPVGSGPYQFKKLRQDHTGRIVSLDLKRFDREAYISEISFHFFETEEALIEAARAGKIDGFSIHSPAYVELFQKNDFNKYSLSLPRYFAIFFNPDKSKFLAQKEIRKALNYGTNKTEIIETVLLGRAKVVDSPILPEIYGYEAPVKIYEFNPEKAQTLFKRAGLEKKEGRWVKITRERFIEFKSDLKLGSRGPEVRALQKCLAKDPQIYPEGRITGYFGPKTKAAVIRFQEKYAEDILEPWGFTRGTGLVGKTTRAKLNEVCFEPPKETPLKFSLITVEDPVLKEVASQIKEQWKNIGVEIEIITYPISQLEREIIKPRNYEMLLFGNVLSLIPDPFPFWHSSQIKDPGLNLAKYENKTVDRLLERARVSLDPEVRAQKYQEFQNILISEAPAVFLYRPDYIYFLSKKVKGFDTEIIADPSKRFTEIDNWFIKTKRVWK